MPERHLVTLMTTDREGKQETPLIAINYLPCVLGRAPECDYRIDDPMVSRRHCAFSYRDGQVWVEDLASRNGTRLNGETVLPPRPVAHGDLLEVGRLPLVVRLEDIPASSPRHTEGLAGRSAMLQPREAGCPISPGCRG
jgi:pSer/pThr/pTyr-binding forkhead associated (FHA) protein